MGIFDRSNELRGMRPVTIVEGWMRSGIDPLFGFVAGPRLDEAEIGRRIVGIPKQAAQLGADAVGQAIRQDDPELSGIGGAYIATSVIRTHEHAGESGVRGEVAKEVIKIAHSVPLGDLAANPNLAPEVAAEATQIIEDANK
jgi:hypothetical protein